VVVVVVVVVAVVVAVVVVFLFVLLVGSFDRLFVRPAGRLVCGVM